MKKKLIKILSASLISMLIVGGSVSTVFFMGHSTSNNTGIDIDDENDDIGGSELTEQEIENKRIKAALAENLSSSNLKIDNLLLSVNGLGSEKDQTFSMVFTGGIDYKAFIDSRLNTSTEDDNIVAAFSGDVNLLYKTNKSNGDGTTTETTNLNEHLLLNANGNGRLYIDWDWATQSEDPDVEVEHNYTKYSIGGKVISDVLDFLPTIKTLTNIEELDNVDEIVEEIKGIDIIPMIPVLTNALMSFSSDTDNNQVADSEGLYTYNLIIPQSLLESASINQDLKIALKCDTNGLLKKITLETLNINGIEISLDVDTQMNVDGTTSYVNNSEYTGNYNDLDCTTNVLTTITSLVNEKKFNTDFSLTFKEYSNEVLLENEKEIGGSIKGDLTNATAINDGAIYDIELGGNTTISSKVNVLYKDKTTYFNVSNGLAKGYLENTTIDNMVSDLTSTLDSQDSLKSEDALETLNNVLKDSAIIDIINGNWSAYKNIIKDLVIENEVMSIKLDAKGITSSLPEGIFSLDIDLSNNKLNSISIKDLPFLYTKVSDSDSSTYKLDFTLNLVDYKEIDITTNYGQLSEYANFEIVSPIYDTLARVVKNKQVGTTFTFDYQKEGDTESIASVNGELNADLNDLTNLSIDTNNFSLDSAIEMIDGKSLGLYGIKVNGDVNDVPHHANLVYQDQNLLFSYYGLTEEKGSKMKLTQGKVLETVEYISSLLSTSNDEDDNSKDEAISTVNTTLNELLDLTDGKIWKLLSSDYLNGLKDYITIKNVENTTAIEITIDLDLMNYKFSYDDNTISGDNTTSDNYVTVTLDSSTSVEDSKKLLAISGSAKDDDNIFTYSLSFSDYVSPEISDTSAYKDMNTTLDSILNIIKLTSNSFAVEGELSSPRQ